MDNRRRDYRTTEAQKECSSDLCITVGVFRGPLINGFNDIEIQNGNKHSRRDREEQSAFHRVGNEIGSLGVFLGFIIAGKLRSHYRSNSYYEYGIWYLPDSGSLSEAEYASLVKIEREIIKYNDVDLCNGSRDKDRYRTSEQHKEFFVCRLEVELELPHLLESHKILAQEIEN